MNKRKSMEKNVVLTVSYDTEHAVPDVLPRSIISSVDYDKLALSERQTLWADYLNRGIWDDPEHISRSVRELETVAELASLYKKYNGAFTSFVLGRWLDFMGESIGEQKVRSYFADVAEIGSHSYDHRAFQSTGDATREKMAPTIDSSEAGEQVRRSIESIRKWLNVTPSGLRTPMGNIRKFGSEEIGILQALQDNGLVYVSSWLKAAQREWNQPEHVQPFYYSDIGFGNILEIPGVGAYDVHFVQPTKSLIFGEESPDLSVNGEKMDGYYIRLLENAIRLSEKQNQTIYIPLVFHPHALRYYDPNLTMHDELLRFCRKEGITVSTYEEVNQRMRV